LLRLQRTKRFIECFDVRSTLLIIHLREISKIVTNVTISEKLTSLKPNFSQVLRN
jgi:hypothetical protein